MRRQRIERERAERMESAGLPARHREKLRDESRHDMPGFRDSVEKAVRACEQGGMLALVGNRGTGKTQVAVEVAARMMDQRNASARYVKARMLGMHLRETFDDPRTSERQALQKWVRPHLLVIDDCHELSEQKEYDRSILTLLADLRYDQCRPTMLLANVAPENTGRLFGASITDRLNDGGGVIAFTGKSLRGARHGQD